MYLELKIKRVQENLLKHADLDLNTALNIARAAEIAQEQVKIIYSTESQEENISMVQNKAVKKNCFACGRSHERIKQKCPAYGKQCNKCKAFNHFAAQCKTKNIKNLSLIEDEKDEE